MVTRDSPHRTLLTWADRGVDGPAPAHHGGRPAGDHGPVLRLVNETDPRHRYHRAVILTMPTGRTRAAALVRDLRQHISEVELREVPIDDPSDYRALWRHVPAALHGVPGASADEGAGLGTTDVLLSAGTPQAQTVWVLLVQAGLLRARMLQVIPAAFVPHPHPRAIRPVSLDVDGFPAIRVLREEVERLRAAVRIHDPRVVASSDAMRALMARAAKVAASALPVLVLGETGTGKELLARALHDGSARAAGPIVSENCGALAESVLASELFGHEAGAFTGATSRHRGLFERAHGGTVFLDEVGELPPAVQAMLLRVLQDGTLRRVGGEATVRVDVRVVAATHRDLAAMVARGTFREDLYYRLRGVELVVPPLRERISDLPALISTFVREARGHARHDLSVAPAAMRALAAYRWPGNVRELRSEVQRWVVFCDGVVDLADLAPEIRGQRAPTPARPAPSAVGAPTVLPLAEVVQAAEAQAIAEALDAHAGNLARTARALGIERNTLKRKLRQRPTRSGR